MWTRRVLAELPLALTPVLLAWAWCGCDQQKALPGNALGTFAITGKISVNNCGTGLNAADPWDYEAELSRDKSSLYWRQANLDTFTGPVTSSGAATITHTTTTRVAVPDGGVSNCSMMRTDTLNVSIGSDAAPTTTSGSLTFAFASALGADCSSQLVVNGGTYATLPCQLAYSLTGTKK